MKRHLGIYLLGAACDGSEGVLTLCFFVLFFTQRIATVVGVSLDSEVCCASCLVLGEGCLATEVLEVDLS